MALDRYALAARIRELLEDELAASGFELLDARVYRGGGRLQVRIYVDAPGGVDLEGCARASRSVDPLLEESDLLGERYVIEVSSPGVRRPLRKPEHFARHVGETVDLRGGDPRDPWRLRGRLLGAEADRLLIRPEAEAEAEPEGQPEPPARPVALGEILEADLDPDFDPRALIQADRRRRKEQRRQEREERHGRRPRRRRREGD